MFNNLIESQAKKQKRAGGSFMSIVVHTAVVAALIVVTKGAGAVIEEEKVEKVDFVEVKKDEPKPPEPEKAPPPPDAVAAPPPPKGFQVLSAPIEIPNVIPEIDLSKKVTDEADFSGKGVAGGIAKGVEGGKGPVIQNADQPYFDFQVEKPVVMAPGSQGPAYPDMLRTAGIEGTVLAQFVVDTTGRAEMATFKALKSDNDLFTNAVKNALQRMRFLPAEVGGRKVKQLVQQPFQFSLNR
ncbi:MAG: energy transducer TonB [Gemmatimonadaceae bacterium]|jgi:periplasmic protein TonB|nr:TonB family protein [Gemmatimonadaceae bacterium]MBX9855253.1 energy transducer TonB [Gemmatimonadaceae bacterium]